MKYKLYRMLCVAMSIGTLCSAPLAVFADEQEGTGNVGDITISISDGQSGTQTSGNLDSNTNESSNESSSGTSGSLDESTGGGGSRNDGSGGGSSSGGSNNTYVPTEAEKGAYNEQLAVNRILKNLINDIKNNENQYFLGGIRSSSPEVFNYGYTSLSEDDIGNMLNHVQSFQEYLTQQDGLDQSVDIYDEVNNSEHPQQQLDALQGDWESLTSEVKEQIKSAIAEQEGNDQDFIDQSKYLTGSGSPLQGFNNQTSMFKFNRENTPPFSIQTNFSGVGAYRGPYAGIRTDLINGGFQDFNSWSDRFTALTRFTSNAMSDFCNVGYIEEYHLSNVTTGEIQVVNYTSDERRWRVYNKDTGELMLPQGADSDGYIYTNNPQHSLSTTFNQAGHYRIVAEQQAVYYLRTTVSYDICEYLFDIETRNLLYFNEKTVSNGNGGSVDLGGEQRTGWVETGDVFNWTINDLGEIETDGSAIQRVE